MYGKTQINILTILFIYKTIFMALRVWLPLNKNVRNTGLDYIKATNISAETKRQNMRDINMKMAA